MDTGGRVVEVGRVDAMEKAATKVGERTQACLEGFERAVVRLQTGV